MLHTARGRVTGARRALARRPEAARYRGPLVNTEIIDVGYGGRPGLVGAWLSGEFLIDCGPSSCLPQLLAGLAGRQPRGLVLTHVHLDHAGAAGALVARFPDLPVYVHPRGAPHLLDPTRLLASARRVFGARLDGLLGELTPVPGENVRELSDGGQLGHLRVAFTPGHASHHVAFLDADTGTAFTGDLAGVRLAPGVVVPPTPPPDIDLERWRRSLTLLESWSPSTLALAHFGSFGDSTEQIAMMREALERHAGWAAEGEEAFSRGLHDGLLAQMGPQSAADYEFISMAAQSAAGLRRWLDRGERGEG